MSQYTSIWPPIADLKIVSVTYHRTAIHVDLTCICFGCRSIYCRRMYHYDLHDLNVLKMIGPSNTVPAHMMPEGIETRHLDDRLCAKQGGTCVNMTCCTDNNYVTGLCVEGGVCCLGEPNCDWKIAQSKTNFKWHIPVRKVVIRHSWFCLLNSMLSINT